MALQRVGIIGYGAFGAFLEELAGKYAPEVEVRIHSSRFEEDGTTYFSLENVCDVDALLLCVPIHAFEETLLKVKDFVRPDTVIIDVATVKKYTCELLKKHLADQPYIATHPMFGPESYKKKGESLEGVRVVISDYTVPAGDVEALSAFLTGLGIKVLAMTPDDHDKRLASTLFLTHYIGQIVHQGGFERTDIDTVSFGFLMDAVDSVRHDSELFKDVYKYNPYCKETIERFESSESQIRSTLSD